MEPPAPNEQDILLALYLEAKCFQAILPCIDTLTIFKRNEWTVDVLYGIIMRISHIRNTSFKQDFSETNLRNT